MGKEISFKQIELEQLDIHMAKTELEHHIQILNSERSKIHHKI